MLNIALYSLYYIKLKILIQNIKNEFINVYL